MSEHKGSRRWEFLARNGSVIVIPYETNLAWKHEVPKSSLACGRRISITIRAFT